MSHTKFHAENNEEIHKEKISKDDLEDIIWVTEFTEESAKDFAEKLFKKSEKDSIQPIVVYIDSYGGEIHSLFSMISAMDSVPNKIITVCMGKAMSAGSALLSHGDIRYVNEHSRIMLHEATSGTGGNVNDIKIDTKELEFLNDAFLNILAKNCGKPLSRVKKLFTNKKREIYLGAKESVEFGIADRIGMPKINKVVKYEIE